MFALIDANAFYASAHQVFEPQWRNKPLIVLSNDNGIIVAASKQALLLGIKKFTPYFKVKKFCEQHGVIAVSSNFPLYIDLSQKLMSIVQKFAPDSYIYSIDEQFLSFQGHESTVNDYFQLGRKIRRTVWQHTRIPVSVGFGKTLTLCKAASHASKRVAPYRGICVLDEQSEIDWVLSQMSLDKVWGIGKRLQSRIEQLLNVSNAHQLAGVSAKLAARYFGVEVERIVLELSGVKAKHWDEVRAAKQQIYSTKSYTQRLTTYNELRSALCNQAAIASRKAREQHSLCRTLVVFAGNSRFEGKHVYHKALHSFSSPTADANKIIEAVAKIADQLAQSSANYYQVGVGLIELVDGRHYQEDLFNASPNNPRLMSVFDGINQKFGRDTIFIAGQGVPEKRHTASSMHTPRYTTVWSELPQISC